MAAKLDNGANITGHYNSICPIDPKFASLINDEALAEASHELRTPLSSIRNSLTLLRLGAAGPISQDAIDVLDLVDRNTVRLMNLIDEILFTKSASLILEPVSIDTLISNSIEMVLGEAKSRDLKIRFENSNLEVLGDGQRLQQVIVNLLSNAVKFSPDGCTITISARAQSSRSASIAITDQGPGVPADEREKIFQKFAQGSNLQRGKGAGLGLAISKRIIEQHGGQIGVRDAAGTGATFWVRLRRVHSSESNLSQSRNSGGKVA